MTKKSYLLVSLVSLLVLAVGVSVAYFTVQIEGTGKTMSVDTANLRVIFTDTNAAIDAADIKPGWTASKTFTVESKTDAAYDYNIVIKNLVNTFVTSGYLQYQIVGSGGGVSQGWTNIPKSASAKDTVIYYSATLPVGVTHSYTINFRYLNDASVDQSADMGKVFSGSIEIQKGTEDPSIYLTYHVLDDNDALEEASVPQRTSFDATYTDSTTTFFKTNNAEHGDTVFYYAGNATNNWVIFGTCKDSTYNCTVGHDLYWRIIRTNEESTGGGIRLLYSGSGSATANGHKSIATTTNGYIKATAFYSGTDSTHYDRYVGYMYGTSGYTLANIRENTESSTIKGVIDAWYSATFTESNLKSKISTTAVYCNDRSYTNATWYTSGSSYNNFGAKGRLQSAKAPSYACGANASGYGNYFTGGNDKADKFSAEETTYGNGKLKDTSGNPVPVALMTADEVAFAGGKYFTGLSSPYAWYYLNAGTGSATGSSFWWTMSPNYAPSSCAYLFCPSGSGSPGSLGIDNGVRSSGVARPVLSLDSEILWLQGDGTANDPYRIVEN